MLVCKVWLWAIVDISYIIHCDINKSFAYKCMYLKAYVSAIKVTMLDTSRLYRYYFFINNTCGALVRPKKFVLQLPDWHPAPKKMNITA